MAGPAPVIAIVCDTASAVYGGEAILPIHYFRHLRHRGFEVWLVTHERSRNEFASIFPSESRVCYVAETALHRMLWRTSRLLPGSVGHFTFGLVSRLSVQAAQRRIIRRLVDEEGVNVVHQPTPVSPREPSLLYGLGVPVVIGPMNGGMNYPAAFAARNGRVERFLRATGRHIFAALNHVWPGKQEAAALLVANDRTRAVLPGPLAQRAIAMSENGVDLDLWRLAPRGASSEGRPLTFTFVGRLVPLKAVDLLLEAFYRAGRQRRIRLTIIGDGAERGALEQQVRRLADHRPQGSEAEVRFAGWLSQQECAHELSRSDCLVMPSLHDCGGAVVLEAMASGLPVIATAWGGALDYLDSSCGILIDPAGAEAFVEDFAEAMIRLADSPAERHALGRAGRRKVERGYDWRHKVDRMVGLYFSVLDPPVADVARRPVDRRRSA